MSALYPVWCEVVCDACSASTAGRFVNSQNIPRRAMKREAERAGWGFRGHAMYCRTCDIRIKTEEAR